VRPGVAGLGEARHGVAGLGEARRGAAGLGRARRGMARLGVAGHGLVRPGGARQGTARQGRARQGKANYTTMKGFFIMAKPKESKSASEDITRQVILEGVADIMFDRYAGDNKTKLEVYQRLYFSREDGRTLVLPALNIKSFLSAQNTTSAPKRLLPSKQYKEAAHAALSYVIISPMEIPFLRDGKPITFGKFKGDVDPDSGVYIHRSVARLKDGIPNPKERPTLPVPWALAFTLTIMANDELQEQQLVNLIQNGGRALGLGTFRGVFGKFRIAKWE